MLEKAMATHSSTLARKIPWMEEPGMLQSMGSRRVGHNWATSLSLFTFMHWRGNGNPLQCSCLKNPRDGGAWWAAVYGVAQSRTWMKWLSSSSSTSKYVLVDILLVVFCSFIFPCDWMIIFSIMFRFLSLLCVCVCVCVCVHACVWLVFTVRFIYSNLYPDIFLF